MRTVAAVVVKVVFANVQMVGGKQRSIWALYGAKRSRRFIYGRTRKEVTDKLKAEHQPQEDYGTLPTGRMPTVAQFLDAWLVSVRQTVRPKTYVSYEGMVRLHIKPWIGRHDRRS